MKNKLLFTFIIPTYNSEQLIRKCLDSIKKQKFNVTKFEVFVLDGGSTDKTTDIANTYKSSIPLKIINNPKRDAESAKFIGLKRAKGEYIILLDSDNEIVSREWLLMAETIIKKHDDIWGIESPWYVNPTDPLINQYFAMLRVADPVARLFSPIKERIKDYKKYELVTVDTSDTPVTGANGFFWKRKLVQKELNIHNRFEETNYVSFLISSGNVTYARMKNNGVYHYYSDSVSNYIKKRIKIANKFLARKANNQTTWVDKVGKFKFYIAIFYNFSIICPTIESLISIVKYKNIAWVYHPLISFLTVTIYTIFYIRKKFFLHAVK